MPNLRAFCCWAWPDTVPDLQVECNVEGIQVKAGISGNILKGDLKVWGRVCVWGGGEWVAGASCEGHMTAELRHGHALPAQAACGHTTQAHHTASVAGHLCC